MVNKSYNKINKTIIFFQVTTLTPYATTNHNNPNITEIVFENDLEETLDRASAAQLKDTPDPWAAIETFQTVFRVFLTIISLITLFTCKKIVY